MKIINGFVTNDSFIDNTLTVVSNVFELSDSNNTYAKEKQTYTYSLDSKYALKVFDSTINNIATTVSAIEADSILSFVDYAVKFATNNPLLDFTSIIVNTMSSYNLNNTDIVTNYGYISLVNSNGFLIPDYLYFTLNNNIQCMLWTSSETFKLLYSKYEIVITLPIPTFITNVGNITAMVNDLNAFDIIEFNTRLDSEKYIYPSTHTKLLNIPFKIPNSNTYVNCYFGFNIYGEQGVFDDILKITLQEYLLTIPGITMVYLENFLPSILEINEFFITPRYDLIAISSNVGQAALYSQNINSTIDTFTSAKLPLVIPMYDSAYVVNNTYNVPIEYNNILVMITNGFYTDINVKDFKTIYPDMLNIATTQLDFSKMSTVTQEFILILLRLMLLSDSNDFITLFTKLTTLTNMSGYAIRSRNSVTYITYKYLNHTYYILPKFEFKRITGL